MGRETPMASEQGPLVEYSAAAAVVGSLQIIEALEERAARDRCHFVLCDSGEENI